MTDELRQFLIATHDEKPDVSDRLLELTYPREIVAFEAGADTNVLTKWHDLRKDPEDFPKTSGRYLVYTGGEPFFLDFDTEVNSFGYWIASFGDDWGIQDEYFETVKESGEDEVIAWKEIVMPKEVENGKM